MKLDILYNGQTTTHDVDIDDGFTLLTAGTYCESDISILRNKEELPDGYQRVVYIESTGSQAINTLCKQQSSTFEIEISFALTNSMGSSAVFGGYRTTAPKQIITLYNNNFYLGDAEPLSAAGYSFQAGILYTLKCSVSELSHVFIRNVNGTEQSFSFSGTINKNDLNMFLFAQNDNGRNIPSGFSKVRIYSFSWVDGESLVSNLVPCYRISDAIAGMYDLQRGFFLTNVGTGSFIAGPEV